MESDRDFVLNNLELCVEFLERDNGVSLGGAWRTADAAYRKEVERLKEGKWRNADPQYDAKLGRYTKEKET